MVSKHVSVAIRFTPEDRAIIEALQERTGLSMAGVLRLAIRTLRDKLAPEDKPRRPKR